MFSARFVLSPYIKQMRFVFKGLKAFVSVQIIAGKTDEALLHRITNCNRATRGQFPWQFALYIDNSRFCGGSLISKRWILTAALCK